MSRDFTQANMKPMYKAAIAEAAQPATDPAAAPVKEKTPKKKKAKVERKSLGLSVKADLYEYVATMSSACGMSILAYVESILEKHKEEHADQYKKAIKMLQSINKEDFI